MRIGELARRAGVSVQAIRFYERRGVLREPPRTHSGYRVYTNLDVEWLRLIREAQNFGFKLKEIRTIVRLCSFTEESHGKSLLSRCRRECLPQITRMCEQKLAEIEKQVNSLSLVRRALAGAVLEFRASARAERPPSQK
jgi:MerR family mercuric resistance operon transcriptional regulator